MTLCMNLINKAVANLAFRFFYFLVLYFLSKVLMASTLGERYLIKLTPYTQQIEYKESENSRIFNQEQGTLNGLKYQLSYLINDWGIELSGDHSFGNLDYVGQTQLGRTAATKTNINRDIFQLLLSKELIDFSKNDCLACGKISIFTGGKYDLTHRDILSKGKITGLEETYQISMAELGLTWQVPNLIYVDWMLNISHSQAFKSSLDINFLSPYDNTKVPLNDVYVNEAELLISYLFLKKMTIGLKLKYSESEIEKSDVFPLYKQQRKSGSFYQPQREIQSILIGLQLSADF